MKSLRDVHRSYRQSWSLLQIIIVPCSLEKRWAERVTGIPNRSNRRRRRRGTAGTEWPNMRATRIEQRLSVEERSALVAHVRASEYRSDRTAIVTMENND